MKITKLDTIILKEIRAEINSALKSVSDKFGLAKIETLSGSYNENSFAFKIQGILDGVVATNHDAQYAEMLGLPSDIIGRTIIMNGVQFKVERLEPNRPKNQIVIMHLGNGKTYKTTADSVRLALR